MDKLQGVVGSNMYRKVFKVLWSKKRNKWIGYEQ